MTPGCFPAAAELRDRVVDAGDRDHGHAQEPVRGVGAKVRDEVVVGLHGGQVEVPVYFGGLSVETGAADGRVLDLSFHPVLVHLAHALGGVAGAHMVVAVAPAFDLPIVGRFAGAEVQPQSHGGVGAFDHPPFAAPVRQLHNPRPVVPVLRRQAVPPLLHRYLEMGIVADQLVLHLVLSCPNR